MIEIARIETFIQAAEPLSFAEAAYKLSPSRFCYSEPRRRRHAFGTLRVTHFSNTFR